MDRMLWERDGGDWPHREFSRFVTAAGMQWHIQRFPALHAPDQAPWLLLLHGTGASSHSWRSLIPCLRQEFSILNLDLPGHAFSGAPVHGVNSTDMSLPGIARQLGSLLAQQEVAPALAIGHSAGAAIGVRMCLDGWMAPRMVVGLNAALLPLGGAAGTFFSPAAKLLARASWVPRLFSWRAQDPALLRRLIDTTGSVLDPTGMALYGKLIRHAGHAAGALGMMANWDLGALAEDLPRLRVPLQLIVGSQDLTVSPAHSDRAMRCMAPEYRRPVIQLQGLGHLAHEEQAPRVAQELLSQWHAP
jgi:magnesium chelatase accessory protein